MSSHSDNPNDELSEFVATYEGLVDRFGHDENARAFLNEVVAQLMATLQRKGRDLSSPSATRYFLWLLSVKGFGARGFAWRDVDRPRRQCDRRPVTNLPLDAFDLECDTRFSHDPRPRLTNAILLAQAVEDLEDHERGLLMSRVVEGHTLQEIADTAAITPQGVKKRLDRVYARVRENLSQAAAQGRPA